DSPGTDGMRPLRDNYPLLAEPGFKCLEIIDNEGRMRHPRQLHWRVQQDVVSMRYASTVEDQIDTNAVGTQHLVGFVQRKIGTLDEPECLVERHRPALVADTNADVVICK